MAGKERFKVTQTSNDKYVNPIISKLLIQRFLGKTGSNHKEQKRIRRRYTKR